MQRQQTITQTYLQGFKAITILCMYLFLGILNYSVVTNMGVKIFLIIVMGIILCGSLNLAHECLHNNFVRHRGINNWVGIIASGALLVNFSFYKVYHLKHHKYVGTNLDTEKKVLFKNIGQYLTYLSGLPFAIRKVKDTLKVLCGLCPSYYEGYPVKRAFYNSVYIALFLASMALLSVFQTTLILQLYLLPLLLAYGCIIFFSLPEHYGCEKKLPGFYTLARSTKSNWMIRHLLWGGNFHAEHHLFPHIPSSEFIGEGARLPEGLYYQEKSYLSWHMRLFAKLLRQSWRRYE